MKKLNEIPRLKFSNDDIVKRAWAAVPDVETFEIESISVVVRDPYSGETYLVFYQKDFSHASQQVTWKIQDIYKQTANA
jgi:hypothetical protein